MIKNFFLIALRNVARHKVFTLINITGLAIGLAASFLIQLWIQDELSYEKFNVNASNTYRVEEDQFYSGERYHVSSSGKRLNFVVVSGFLIPTSFVRRSAEKDDNCVCNHSHWRHNYCFVNC